MPAAMRCSANEVIQCSSFRISRSQRDAHTQTHRGSIKSHRTKSVCLSAHQKRQQAKVQPITPPPEKEKLPTCIIKKLPRAHE